LECKVVRVGRKMKVESVPKEVGMGDAVSVEGPGSVDDLPVRIIEVGIGEAGVVPLVDKPGGREIERMGEGLRLDIVGVDWRGCLGPRHSGKQKE